MVNTGKPSGACRLCRARRVKCDETKPSCLKCFKYGRQCPGYRDLFEVKIRDETQNTIRRLQRKPRFGCIVSQIHDPSGHLPAPKTQQFHTGYRVVARTGKWRISEDEPHRFSQYDDNATKDYESDDLECFLVHVDFPVEEQATCFFLSDFIMLPTGPGSRGYHYFVHSMLKRRKLTLAFKLSFKAVAMAALSSRPGSQALVNNSRVWYSRAIREVSKALQDSELVKDDQTLAAILLLAFYEVLAPRAQLTEYINHMRGAATVVGLRGPAHASLSPEVIEMYALTRNQLLTIYAMPLEHHLDLRDYHFLATPMPGNVAWTDRVATLNIACTKLRSEVDILLRRWPRPSKRQNNGDQESDQERKKIEAAESAYAKVLLNKGVTLLLEMEKFRSTTPPPWAPEVIPVFEWMTSCNAITSDEGASMAFPGQEKDQADVYRWGTYVAGILNVITWTTQILATTTVLRLASATLRAEKVRAMEEADDKPSHMDKGNDVVGSLPSPAPSMEGDCVRSARQSSPSVNCSYRNHPALAVAQKVARQRITDLIAATPYFFTWNGTNSSGASEISQSHWREGSSQRATPFNAPVLETLQRDQGSSMTSQNKNAVNLSSRSLVPSSEDGIFPCGSNEAYIRTAAAPLLNGPRGAAPTKGLIGMMMIWPLFTCKASDFCTSAEKDYLTNRLTWLRDVLGIRQAGILLTYDEISSPTTDIEKDMTRLRW